MPGGRLTHHDRQHIASGLAQGLGYAEIARRLQRPTSTVSREVARNGSPDRYQAEQAHQAAARRARRRPPAPSPATPTAADADGPNTQAVRAFEARFAAMLIQAGFPRMPARVLVCLFTSATGSRTAAELAQRLQVSPASVSKAVGYLERLEFIRRARDARPRRERYLIDDDVWDRAWSRIGQSYALWADLARDGAQVLGPATPGGARLEEMAQFAEILGRSMAQATQHWRQSRSAPPRPPTAGTGS